MPRKLNQLGFSAIEGLLIVIIALMIGFIGYYVYHTQNQTDAINNTATKVAQSSPAKGSVKQTTTTATKPATQYFTIKEWGVQAPNASGDTFTYSLDSTNSLATVISQRLAKEDSGCSTFGAGQIRRLLGTDGSGEDGSGPSVATYAQQNPGTYTHIGNYYYQFVHDQAECGSVSVTDQNQSNDQVKALVAAFVAE